MPLSSTKPRLQATQLTLNLVDLDSRIMRPQPLVPNNSLDPKIRRELSQDPLNIRGSRNIKPIVGSTGLALFCDGPDFDKIPYLLKNEEIVRVKS